MVRTESTVYTTPLYAAARLAEDEGISGPSQHLPQNMRLPSSFCRVILFEMRHSQALSRCPSS